MTKRQLNNLFIRYWFGFLWGCSLCFYLEDLVKEKDFLTYNSVVFIIISLTCILDIIVLKQEYWENKLKDKGKNDSLYL